MSKQCVVQGHTKSHHQEDISEWQSRFLKVTWLKGEKASILKQVRFQNPSFYCTTQHCMGSETLYWSMDEVGLFCRVCRTFKIFLLWHSVFILILSLRYFFSPLLSSFHLKFCSGNKVSILKRFHMPDALVWPSDRELGSLMTHNHPKCWKNQNKNSFKGFVTDVLDDLQRVP